MARTQGQKVIEGIIKNIFVGMFKAFFEGLFEAIAECVKETLKPFLQYMIVLSSCLLLENLIQALCYGTCMIYTIAIGDIPDSIKEWTLEDVAEYGSCGLDHSMPLSISTILSYMKWIVLLVTIARICVAFLPTPKDQWETYKMNGRVCLVEIVCLLLLHLVLMILDWIVLKFMVAKVLQLLLYAVMVPIYILRFQLFA